MKFKDIKVGGVYFDSGGTKSKYFDVTQEALDNPGKNKIGQRSLLEAKVTVLNSIGYYRASDFRRSWQKNTPNLNGKMNGHLNQGVKVLRADGREDYARVRDILGEWDIVIPGLIEETKVRVAEGKVKAKAYVAHREYEMTVREPALLKALARLAIVDPEITRDHLDRLPDKTIEFLGNYPW
jgi:hypothetical protein